MIGKFTIAGALTAAALALAVQGGGSAWAQYPPPSGNCVISTSASTATPGASVGLTVTVRDASGAPIANASAPLSVASQPGNDAKLTAGAAATNAAGQLTATLNAGTTPGVVVVTAHPAGTSCSASVVTGAGQVAAAVTLPNTGTGAAGDATPIVELALLIGLAGVALLRAAVAGRRTVR